MTIGEFFIFIILMNYLIDWYKEEKPLNFKSIFKNENSIDCEIGFGEGDFLIKKAIEEKNKNLIGIEYSKVCIRKTLKRIKENKINNINLILLDAESAFEILIPEASIDNIYINFPDPWPKNRHEKRRLLDKEFSILASSRLKEKGHIHILTDHTFYRDFILEEMSHYRVLRPLYENGYTDKIGNIIETKYLRKWKSLGKGIYYILLQKVMHPFSERKIKECRINEKIKIKTKRDDILKLLNKSLKHGNSIVKVLKIEETQNDFNLQILFKDYSLFQKKKLTLKKQNEDYELILPDSIFLSDSFELFLKYFKH